MGNQFHGKYRLEKPDPVKVIREKLHKGTEKRQYNPAYELTPEEEQLELASHARWLNQVLNKDKKEEEKTWYPSRLTDMSEAEADRICNEAMGKTFADRPETLTQLPEMKSDLPLSSGQPLPEYIRTFFENRYLYDFSGVKVHDTPQDHIIAEKYNARALAHGTSIVFNRNEYQPGTFKGNQILGHELAHTMQQNKMGKAVVQRKAKTWGGEWSTDKYDIVKWHDKPYGVNIILRFSPEKLVDAEKIALIQVAHTYTKGKFPNEQASEIRKRRVIKYGPHKGSMIDVGQFSSNPIYFSADNEFSTAKNLGTTKVNRSRGQWGWQYRDNKGMLQKQDALLKDEPTFSHWEPPAGQILITTAMAVSGKQKGTIYGSVQWGWQVDVKGNFVKLPLTVKSFGEPSQAFIAAAGQWNEHQHFFKSKKNPLLMLELPQILYTNRSGAYLVGSPVNWKKSIIVTLPAHTKVQGTAVKGNWYRVTVVDGKFAGQVGWIMFNLLSEKKV